MAMCIAIYVNLQVGSDAYITLSLTKSTPAPLERKGGKMTSTCGKIWLPVAMSIAIYVIFQVDSDAFITSGLIMKNSALASVMILMTSNAVAGWYRVTNYVGEIGASAIHFSMQRYEFGPGTNVLGSYYYDKHRSPILIYGLENDDKSLTLCDVHTPEEYEKAIVHGFKNGAYAIGCPLHLALTDEGAVGEWRDSRHSYSVSLRRVGSLDTTKESLISGTMEIPFWGQTEKYAFIGIYQASFPEVKVQVVNKKTGMVAQTLISNPDCLFGYYMTSIYMNLERSHFHPEEVYLNCWSPHYGQSAYYSFDKKTGEFRWSRDR